MTSLVTSTCVDGFDALVIENPFVRAVILPSIGGRIWELVDRVRDRQWIWHRDDVALAPSVPGASYDDAWSGGWEELFPNDAPGLFEGRNLPDHGLWWTTSWTASIESTADEAIVRLEAETLSPGCRCVKEIRLASSSNVLRVRYRIESRERDPFHFLFKQHLPVAITPRCSLTLPGGRVTAVDPTFGTLLAGDSQFDWPSASPARGRGYDLRQIPDSSESEREFVYVSQLLDGWCGVDDREAGASLRMSFDYEKLPFTWLFLAYGGWRGCYTAVLEPCTNMPKDLASALRAGQSARLAAGEVFETEVAVTLAALTT